jgi:hypothetical protein
MSTQINIGPVSKNQNTELKLLFGCNVSASSIVDFVKRDTNMKSSCGLITTNEASAMVEQTEEKLKRLSIA